MFSCSTKVINAPKKIATFMAVFAMSLIVSAEETVKCNKKLESSQTRSNLSRPPRSTELARAMLRSFKE